MLSVYMFPGSPSAWISVLSSFFLSNLHELFLNCFDLDLNLLSLLKYFLVTGFLPGGGLLLVTSRQTPAAENPDASFRFGLVVVDSGNFFVIFDEQRIGLEIC